MGGMNIDRLEAMAERRVAEYKDAEAQFARANSSLQKIGIKYISEDPFYIEDSCFYFFEAGRTKGGKPFGLVIRISEDGKTSKAHASDLPWDIRKIAANHLDKFLGDYLAHIDRPHSEDERWETDSDR